MPHLNPQMSADLLPIPDNFFRSELVIAFGVPRKQRDGNSLTIFIFPVALRPNTGYGLLILEVSRSYTMTHHSR